MGISLKPEHLKRYKDIARLMLKYGRSDLVATTGLDQLLIDEPKENGRGEPKAEELAHDLEHMGPIFVKLGQVLSSRADMMPPSYIKALSRLQDELEPFSFEEVESIIEEELGIRLSRAFAFFDRTPISAASLGQVHRATLRDGRSVVVKVQRPGIRKQIAQDMEALLDVAEFIDAHTDAGRQYRFTEILEDFRKNLARELDYKQEAQNLVRIGENLKGFDLIIVPTPIVDYTTTRVLTMDYIRGTKVTSLSPLGRLEIDGSILAEELFSAYLKQTLVDGVFHADPHPGNVFITNDGRIALIDLGMIGYLSHSMQEQLLKLLLAISEARGDEATEVAIKIGEKTDQFNELLLRRRVTELVGQLQESTVEQMQIGRAMLNLQRLSSDSGIRAPMELAMIGKTLLNLDEIARSLDPQFNPNDAIRRNAADITRQRLFKAISPGRLFSAAMEAKEFTEELPKRINRILDALSNNQLKMTVEAIDERTLIEGFQKVANRIASGAILASLIIGAALLMQVPTKFRIFGYPGLAMLCFIAAAAGGIWLVATIFLHDRDTKKTKTSRS